MALDFFGSIGIPQSGQGFFVVIVARGYRADHQGLGVTAEGVLQDSG